MIVVDAGVWVRAIVDDGDTGDQCRQLLTADPDWVMPGHAPVEVLRTIRRYESAGIVTADQAEAYFDVVVAAQVRYIGPEPWILESVWTLRHNISPYDAPYAAIASAHDCELATLDDRLARACRSIGTRIAALGT